MTKETRQDYDAQLQELLGIYETHKALTLSIEKGQVWAGHANVTYLQWISSEGTQGATNNATS